MNRSLFNIGAASAGMILSLSLLSSCDKKNDESQPKGLPPVDVEVTKVVHKDVNIPQEWIGSLRGTEDADIRAQVSGYLMSKNYKDGSYVKKGDVLFQIDKRPFEAALLQAQGTLAQQQASAEKYKLDVERYTPLAARESIGEKQLDDARQSLRETEAAIVSAKAAVEQAEINLQFSTITAPISGLTGIAKPSIGNLLSPSAMDPLTTISAIDPIRVDFSISEKDLLDSYAALGGKKEKKKTFDVILSNGEQYPHPGEPVSLDRNVSRETGTINIVGHIPNPDHMLRPGMFVRVKAVTQTLKNATLVPPRAIMSMQSSNFVVMVNGDKTSIFPVIPGPVDESGRLQVIEPMKGEFPKDMTVVVEGLLQAAQRADGKGTVNVKQYTDKPSAPVIQPKKSAEDAEAKQGDTQEQPVPAQPAAAE